MTFLATSEALHEDFLSNDGLVVLDHCLKKADHYFLYLALKMFSILSRNKKNMVVYKLL